MSSPDAHLAAVAHLPTYHSGAPVVAAIIEDVRSDADIQASQATPAHNPFQSAYTVQAHAYLARLIKYSCASRSAVVMMFILIDRWAKNFLLTTQCLHRVMSAAFIAAVYTVDDHFLRLRHYQEICRIRSAKLRVLLTEFLRAIGFDVGAAEYSRVEALLSAPQTDC
eukprot:TRINITY_DN5443_c0_g4_i1.p1 TRINITY_DN5443_c0_g4~~TRINITY_DN5443_c0_g4_i1.p1  ORF type:complete len:192 (+),score=62.02 TRINITY_DN5443_c0_g4_i1:77-577(+)